MPSQQKQKISLEDLKTVLPSDDVVAKNDQKEEVAVATSSAKVSDSNH